MSEGDSDRRSVDPVASTPLAADDPGASLCSHRDVVGLADAAIAGVASVAAAVAAAEPIVSAVAQGSVEATSSATREALNAALDTGAVSGRVGVKTRTGAPAPELALRAVGSVDVLREIDQLLTWSKDNNSRIGFFAALYWHVATGVGGALEEHKFRHPAWVKQLNQAFFGRYLKAVDQYRRGDLADPPTESWGLSFTAAAEPDCIVVQHLLLGVNAHINLDLSIALAEAIGPERMSDFSDDFQFLNEVLSHVTGTVVVNTSRVSRVLKWISRILGRREDQIMGFSIRMARDGAWRSGLRLAAMPAPERAVAIVNRDCHVATIAAVIEKPAWPVRPLVSLIRRLENRDIRTIITELLRKEP
jgi:hypothetical protein